MGIKTNNHENLNANFLHKSMKSKCRSKYSVVLIVFKKDLIVLISLKKSC